MGAGRVAKQQRANAARNIQRHRAVGRDIDRAEIRRETRAAAHRTAIPIIGVAPVAAGVDVPDTIRVERDGDEGQPGKRAGPGGISHPHDKNVGAAVRRRRGPRQRAVRRNVQPRRSTDLAVSQRVARIGVDGRAGNAAAVGQGLGGSNTGQQVGHKLEPLLTTK